MDVRAAWRRGGVVAGTASLGWAWATILGNLVSTPPWACAVIGAAVGWVWTAAAATAGARPALAWPWGAGVFALAIPSLAPILRAHGPTTSFERVGLLWLGGAWERVDAATYLTLLGLGALLGAICLAMLWLARRDRTSAWTAGLTSLGLAAVWRTVVFPPSGDEPTLLFAAWHWLGTGSLDLSHAAGEPAEVWSRAIDFRADLPFHTVGMPGGAVYTFHGLLLPCLYGIGLALGGRIGLALLLVAAAAAAVRLTERAAEALLGRPVPPRWILALLAGGPLAVYTVFMSADLPGAALFALGGWGLVRRRPAAVALAAIALPWINHKLLFAAVGLLLSQVWLAPAAGVLVCMVFLTGFLPEVIMIARAVELPLWPPSALLAHQEKFQAAGVHIFHPLAFLQSVPGVLVQRYAGLINYPVWLLAIVGCWWWAVRSRQRPGMAMQLAALPYLGVLLIWQGWEAGKGSPGRYLVLVFPVLALGLAAVEDRLRGPWRTALAVAVWAGIAVTQLSIFIPPIGYVSAKQKLEAAALSRWGVDPLAILPEFSNLDAGAASPGWLAAVWLAGVGVAWFLCLRRMSDKPIRA